MNEIICADALPWLRERKSSIDFIFTGLPDAAEISMSPGDYRVWFAGAVRDVICATTPAGTAIFCQTDRKHEGQLLSKASVVMMQAERLGCRVLWHRIVLRRSVGAVDLHRPGYQHLIAVSAEGRPGRAMPDVIPPSRSLYPNGMPLAAADAALAWAVGRGYRHVVDPFCGRGTVPARAVVFGLTYTGVDIDVGQVEETYRTLAAVQLEAR